MKETDWKYKIGGDLFAFIPLSILFLVFGGVSVWLHRTNNGAVLFTGFITGILIIIAVYLLYRCLFVKLLIGEHGFYYQNGIARGTYYEYSAIKEAWQSEGKNTNGAVSSYFHFRTADGYMGKFLFTPTQAEGIEYLLTQINSKGRISNEQ